MPWRFFIIDVRNISILSVIVLPDNKKSEWYLDTNQQLSVEFNFDGQKTIATDFIPYPWIWIGKLHRWTYNTYYHQHLHHHDNFFDVPINQ